MKTELLIDLIFQGCMPSCVLFRVDAGRVSGISFGHLSRCLILAKHLQKVYQTDVRFLMQAFPEGVRHAKKNGVKTISIPVNSASMLQEQFILDQVDTLEPDWLVFDIPYEYNYDSVCSRISRKGCKQLFIDDARFITPPVDVVLNSSILAPPRTNLPPKSRTKFLLGPKFFIFDKTRSKEKISKSDHSSLKIVLSFGGSDPSGLSLKVIKTLPQLPSKHHTVTLITGPGFQGRGQIDREIERRSLNVGVVDAPENIYSYFSSADLVICSGGRTIYELAELGVRAFPIASIEHESMAIQAFISSNLVPAGMMAWNPKEFIEKLTPILNGNFS